MVAVTGGLVVAELVDEGLFAFVVDLVVVIGLLVVTGTATALVATTACWVVVVVRAVVGAATVDPIVEVEVMLDAVDEELDPPGPPTSRTRTRMTPPAATMPAPTFTSVLASNDICSP